MISKSETSNNERLLLLAKILKRIPFIPLKYKRKLNDFRHNKIKKTLSEYFLTGQSDIENQNTSEILNKKQKKIWVFWWQGKENMPPVVKLCYESLTNNMGENVILVTKENYQKYTDIPDYILAKVHNEQITLTHFSDIIRFNLLKNNGGLWVDATVFWTGAISWKKYEYLYTCGGYSAEDPDDFFVTGGKWTGFLIGGSSDNKLFSFMDSFFKEYWKENVYLLDYFLIDYALDYAYENNIGDFQKYVDTIAVDNNPKLFELAKLVNKLYDKKKIGEITKKTIAFKLSYKKKVDLTPDGVLHKLSHYEK